ncbi:MAG: hypothetical protein KDA75_03475 [Planctomycetaceae bacterium]|nr:hypothetical protein [Planctomycetaceae bacterium]
MEPNASTLIAEHPEWQLILQAYAAEEAAAAELAAAERAEAKKQAKLAAKHDGPELDAPACEDPPSTDNCVLTDGDENAGDEPGDGSTRKQTWVRRLHQVAGVNGDRLAPMHGRLIAEGLLQFNLGGRDEGVLYRLTREAKQALSALPELTPPAAEDQWTEETQVEEDHALAA